MSGIKGLAHVGLFVSDIERSKRFYTEMLGFEAYYCWTGKVANVALLRLGDCTIEMMEPFQEKTFAAGRYDHLALRVEDIEQVARSLKDKGIVFRTQEITVNPNWGPTGARYILFSGPDGETIEIAEAMQRS